MRFINKKRRVYNLRLLEYEFLYKYIFDLWWFNIWLKKMFNKIKKISKILKNNNEKITRLKQY